MNVVIFHLESFNEIILNKYAQELPEIMSVRQKSEVFCNYYSTATSTYMVLYDLFLRSFESTDSSESLEDLLNRKNKDSFFDVLEKNGYHVAALFYGISPEDETDYSRIGSFVCNTNRVWIGDNEDEFLNSLNKYACEEPFCIFLEDDASHISYSGARKTEEYEHFSDRYKLVDNTFGHILKMLKRKGILENTIILAYGDHGDDFYAHGYNGGLIHACEPYDNIVHCPLFVFQNNGFECNHSIISTEDIGNLLLTKLGIKDSTLEKRIYSFSRNLFPRQKSRMIQKAYSVTDGKYRLLISPKGMELYNNDYDPMNMNNLLQLFTFKSGKLNYREYMGYILTESHYSVVMSKKEIREIETHFQSLYINLFDKVNKYKLKEINHYNKIRVKKNSLRKWDLLYAILLMHRRKIRLILERVLNRKLVR